MQNKANPASLAAPMAQASLRQVPVSPQIRYGGQKKRNEKVETPSYYI